MGGGEDKRLLLLTGAAAGKAGIRFDHQRRCCHKAAAAVTAAHVVRCHNAPHTGKEGHEKEGGDAMVAEEGEEEEDTAPAAEYTDTVAAARATTAHQMVAVVLGTGSKTAAHRHCWLPPAPGSVASVQGSSAAEGPIQTRRRRRMPT